MIVQDSKHVALPQLPIELYSGTQIDPVKLMQSLVSDARGQSNFEINVGTGGALFTLIAGNQTTGKVMQTVFLSGTDTTVVLMLTGKSIPCGQIFADTIRFPASCAKASNGTEFPDSMEVRYSTACEEPVTVTFQSLDPQSEAVRLRMIVFDENGKKVDGTSFKLSSDASFRVRIIFIPQQEGVTGRKSEFTLQGAMTTTKLDLVIVGVAVLCEECTCSQQSVLFSLGMVVVHPDSFSILQSEININRSICVRRDQLIHGFASGGPFTLESSINESVTPNRGQPITIRFRPGNDQYYYDSLVFFASYPSTGAVCRYTIFVSGEGVSPAICVGVKGCQFCAVDSLKTPPYYSINLRTDLVSQAYGFILFSNCGSGGWINLSQPTLINANGFLVYARKWNLIDFARDPGYAFFDAYFFPSEQLIWPNGRGAGPAVTDFHTTFPILGWKTNIQVNVNVSVDTFPKTIFSSCIYRWDQNEKNGYNFMPVNTKGSFTIDAQANDSSSSMVTDFVYLSGPGSFNTGAVRIRKGWKFIRAGVMDQSDFVYEKIINWPGISTFKSEPFQTAEFTNLNLYSVYVIRIENAGRLLYALVRVREISDDGQKQKLCLDVVFPL